MAKSFKKFREDYDEWDDDNEDRDRKKQKMNIQNQRRKKAQERSSIFDENEKSLYPDSDDKIHCPVPQNILENAGFKNINNPYTYYNRKKLDKHFKMLILFIILMIFIFI